MATKNIIIILVIILLGTGFWLIFKLIPEEDTPVLQETEMNVPAAEISGELIKILAKAENVHSLKYDTMMTMPEGTFVFHFWQKDGRMRMEMTVEGQEMVNLVDVEEETAYMYMPVYNVATKLNFLQMEEIAEGSIKNQSDFIISHYPIVLGSESFEGKDCLVIEYVVYGEKTKMWIWKDYGLPVKMETETGQGLIEVQVSDIDFAEISDSMFELPSGAQITEMSGF